MNFIFRSSNIKKIVEYGDKLYYFSDAGLDVISLANKVSVAYATLANVTCGAVNDNGVYLGTTAAGVYFVSHANVLPGGNITASLAVKFSTSTTPAIPSNVINDMDGAGIALLLGTGAGASYLPTEAYVYSCAVTGGSKKVAISNGYVSWEKSNVAYVVPTPTSNWTYGDAIAQFTVPGSAGTTITPLSNTSISASGNGTDYGRGGCCQVGNYHYFILNMDDSRYAHAPASVKVPVGGGAISAVTLPTPPAGATMGYGTPGVRAGYCIISALGNYAPAFYKLDAGANTWNQLSFAGWQPPAGFSNGYDATWVDDNHVVICCFATAGLTACLYKRDGDVLTFCNSISGLTYKSSTQWSGYQRFTINHSGNYGVFLRAVGSTIYCYQVVNDVLVLKSTTSAPQASNGNDACLSNITSDGFVACGYVYLAASVYYGLNAIFKVNFTNGAVSFITATTTTTPNVQTGGNYPHPTIHPSGRYIIELYPARSSGYDGVVRYFDKVGTISTIGQTSALAINGDVNGRYCFFLEDGLLATDFIPSNNMCLYVGTFTYPQQATTPFGTVIRDLAGGGSGAVFVATDTGVMIYDASSKSANILQGIFGINNNMISICPSPEARWGHGTLAYGISNGSNKGQAGVINLRSQRNMITKLGDQGEVWSGGTEIVAYKDQIDWEEDTVPSTRKILLVGDSVKDIVKYGGYMFHFTEAGLDVHRIADGVRISWALVANVTCGAVNDNGIYFGTSAGVKRLRHSDIVVGLDMSPSVVTAYSTATTPSLQSNTVVDIDAVGGVLAVASSAGVDFLPTESTVFRRVSATAKAVAVDASRFAYSEGNKSYHSGYPVANWTLVDMTESAGVSGTVINAHKFGSDLFIGTNDGISIHNTSTMAIKNISTELGLVRNVVSLHPTSVSKIGSGLVAYGISNGDGTGKFGVLDLGTVA